MAEDKPPDEQLLKQLEEELRHLKVSDVLLQTVFTISSLALRKLSDEERDLEQGRLAIEALRALVPVLREAVGPEVSRDLNQTIATMQFAYAKAVGAPVRPRKGEQQPDA